MSGSLSVIAAAFLIPLALFISYYDVCYRRIPNPFVLATLGVGILMHVIFGGIDGALCEFGGLRACFLSNVCLARLWRHGCRGCEVVCSHRGGDGYSPGAANVFCGDSHRGHPWGDFDTPGRRTEVNHDEGISHCYGSLAGT